MASAYDTATDVSRNHAQPTGVRLIFELSGVMVLDRTRADVARGEVGMIDIAIIGSGEAAAAQASAWAGRAGVAVRSGRAGELDLAAADVVVIAPPPVERAEAIRQAMARRAPALLARVAAPTEAEAQRLAQAAKKRRMTVAVGGGLRLVRPLAQVQEWMTAGVLGTIREIHLHRDGVDSLPWPTAAEDVSRATRCRDLTLALALAFADDVGRSPRQVRVSARGPRGELHLACGTGNTPVHLTEATAKGAWVRDVRVVGSLGTASARVTGGPRGSVTGRATRQLRGERRRCGYPVCSLPMRLEAGAILSALPDGAPWFGVPCLADVVQAMTLAASWTA